MKLFRIVFCSTLAGLGSTQELGTPDAVPQLTPEEVAKFKAYLAAMGDSGQVHVGGTNQDAPLSAGVADINPQAPETAPAVSTTNTEQNQTPGSPTPEILTEPEPVSVDSEPVEPVQTQPVIPVINTEPEKHVISDPLVPSDAELANDNPLMPVDAQAPLETRIEGSDAEIPNEEGEKGVDPAEDKPLGATVEAPTVIDSTTKALNVTATPQPDQKPISLSQELLAAAAAPAAISQELIGAIGTQEGEEFGSRASEEQITQDQETVADQTVPVETVPDQSAPAEDSPVEAVPGQTVAQIDAAPGLEAGPEDEPVEQMTTIDEILSDDSSEEIPPGVGSIDQVSEEIIEEQPVDSMGVFPVETTGITEAAQEKNADSVEELDAITPALQQPEETQDTETASTTPEIESTTEMDTTTTEEPYYADEKALDGEYDEDEYDEDYEEYDDEYDLEDDLDDDYGFGLLDDDYDDEEILPDAQDINGDILKEINDNYRTSAERERTLEEIHEIEEEFDDLREEETKDWNFAFYLIVFVLVSTGVYYVINLIRTKFFPKSVSIQDYLSKKWRYWDGDENQKYSLLQENDPDIKQSVSSESKAEEWNNDDW